ncbi:MAG: hypothetical protein HFI33_08775 [Lachnospiraceae bacterium]|nr:hypothetical protein [Lachnospiraceae bacterium]
MKKHPFILCGLTGWCLEVFWTGLTSLQRRQMKLMGRSSFWMFPIYGTAALLGPISRLLKGKSIWLRGSLYTAGIYLVEFLSGSFLKRRGMCPWDYSKARWNYQGVIRLDFLPIWFLTGLFYERLLSRPSTGTE